MGSLRSPSSKLRLAAVALLVVGLLAVGPATGQAWDESLLEDLTASARAGRIPGLSAAVIVGGEVRWTGAVGLADIEAGRPMTTTTRLNIGSVTKLVTATAIMKLYERGSLNLDVDVSGYLPFKVRHPSFPRTPITTRQLLTHTSGISDSDRYGATYVCGDPKVSLRKWLRGYLTPDGDYFSEESFSDNVPGQAFEYSNVGYGLLGLIVERISGRGFRDYTRVEIFEPLGMTRSGWLLSELEPGEHATPYYLVDSGSEPEPEEVGLLPDREMRDGEFVPFCLYSFYNYPDGLLRTTVEDLATFIAASLPGEVGHERLLKPSTRDEVFRDQLANRVETDGRVQGLGWRRTDTNTFGQLWGHGGADPGVRSHVLHRPEDGVTVVLMVNRLALDEVRPVLLRLFEAGSELAASATQPQE